MFRRLVLDRGGGRTRVEALDASTRQRFSVVCGSGGFQGGFAYRRGCSGEGVAAFVIVVVCCSGGGGFGEPWFS